MYFSIKKNKWKNKCKSDIKIDSTRTSRHHSQGRKSPELLSWRWINWSLHSQLSWSASLANDPSNTGSQRNGGAPLSLAALNCPFIPFTFRFKLNSAGTVRVHDCDVKTSRSCVVIAHETASISPLFNFCCGSSPLILRHSPGSRETNRAQSDLKLM